MMSQGEASRREELYLPQNVVEDIVHHRTQTYPEEGPWKRLFLAQHGEKLGSF
jgi:hypothetical protein